VLLRDRWSKHILEQVLAAKIVLGAGSRGGVKRESTVSDAQWPDDLWDPTRWLENLQRFSAQPLELAVHPSLNL
jgi:hypothetical protein